MTVKLNDKVEDKITGFAGIVTARCEYLEETAQIRISSRKDKKELWCAESRIVKIK